MSKVTVERKGSERILILNVFDLEVILDALRDYIYDEIKDMGLTDIDIDLIDKLNKIHEYTKLYEVIKHEKETPLRTEEYTK
jgi:hypothetical protein